MIQYGDVTLDSDTVRVHVLFFFAPVDVTKVLDFYILGEERNDFQKTSGLWALDVHFGDNRRNSTCLYLSYTHISVSLNFNF